MGFIDVYSEWDVRPKTILYAEWEILETLKTKPPIIPYIRVSLAVTIDKNIINKFTLSLIINEHLFCKL